MPRSKDTRVVSAVKRRRIERQEVRTLANKELREQKVPTPHEAKRAARKLARKNKPEQPRNERGFIILRSGGLKFDTWKATNAAIIAARDRDEERAAKNFEKAVKAKQPKQAKAKVGKVTSRKAEATS
jgi:hypothetical protein